MVEHQPVAALRIIVVMVRNFLQVQQLVRQPFARSLALASGGHALRGKAHQHEQNDEDAAHGREFSGSLFPSPVPRRR